MFNSCHTERFCSLSRASGGNALSDREKGGGGGGGITASLLIRSPAFSPPTSHLAWLQIDGGFDLSIFRSEMLIALVHILLSGSVIQTGSVLQPGPHVPQPSCKRKWMRLVAAFLAVTQHALISALLVQPLKDCSRAVISHRDNFIFSLLRLVCLFHGWCSPVP